MRFFLAFLVLVVASYGRHRPRWDSSALLCGLLLFAGYALQTAGLTQTLPSRSAFITSLSVILVPALQWLVGGRIPGFRVWLAAALALGGLGFLLRPEAAPLSLGDGLTFLCALAFAGHVLALEAAVQRQHPWAVNTVQLGVVAMLSPVVALATPVFLKWTVELVVALAVTGVLASALAFAAMAKVLTVLRAGETGVILAFEPVAAAVVSVLLGYEQLTVRMLFGGLMVVSGVALVAGTQR